jgi:hypothetical protein
MFFEDINMNISTNNIMAANYALQDALYTAAIMKVQVEEIKQCEDIISRINNVQRNIPYMINDCNYVASMSRHNYQYLV